MIAIFRSKLRPGIEDEFAKLGDEMLEIAQSMPGFLSYKVYHAEDGERCSVIEFETREQLDAWRNLPVHVAAQQRGRKRYYQTYSLHVCEPERESRFVL